VAYNEISLPKWQDFVRRRFGLTGPGGNVPVLASEIQGVAVLEPAAFEHELLRHVLHFNGSTGFSTAGTAGQNRVILSNPAGSNKLVVVQSIDTLLTHEHDASSMLYQTTLYMNDDVANPIAWDSGPWSGGAPCDARISRVQPSCCVSYWDASHGATGCSIFLGRMPLRWVATRTPGVASYAAADFQSAFYYWPLLLKPGTSVVTQQQRVIADDEAGMTTSWRFYEFEEEIAESAGRV